jgi:hypothetical protein
LSERHFEGNAFIGLFSQLNRKSKTLLDHPVRSCQQARGNCHANLLRGFQIDHQLKLGWLFNGKLRGLAPFKTGLLGGPSFHLITRSARASTLGEMSVCLLGGFEIDH